MSTRRELLRHVIATIAYRGGKALRNAPAGFSEVRLENGSRSAGEILAHVCDLFAWAVQMCRGEHVWSERRSATWDEEVNRFHQSLAELDEVLQSTQPLGFTEEKIAGLSVFLILPGHGDPVARFDAMVELARSLADDLDGVLLDERGSSWSIQRERYVREEIIRYRHQHSHA